MAAGLARARQARVGRLAAWALEQTPQGGTAPGRTTTKKHASAGFPVSAGSARQTTRPLKNTVVFFK